MIKEIINELKINESEIPLFLKDKELILFKPRSLKRSLRSMIEGKKKGIKVIGRIVGEYTDDYSNDKADDYGRTNWLPVKIVKEEKRSDGKFLYISDYVFKNGNFWQNVNGIVNMDFAGNANYEFIAYVE